MSFKYGDKILVKDKTDKDYYKRILIIESKRGYLCSYVNDTKIEDFEENPSWCRWWDEAKAIEKAKEPTYRPFTMEEFREHKNKWFVDIVTSAHSRVEFFYADNDAIYLANRWQNISAQCLLREFTFEDGSPCGVEVEK